VVVAAAPAASGHECDAHDPDLAFTPAGIEKFMERMSCGRYRLSWWAGGAGADDVEINGYRATIVPAARALARHLGETVHVTPL
jgi:hypothetical protein